MSNYYYSVSLGCLDEFEATERSQQPPPSTAPSTEQPAPFSIDTSQAEAAAAELQKFVETLTGDITAGGDMPEVSEEQIQMLAKQFEKLNEDGDFQVRI